MKNTTTTTTFALKSLVFELVFLLSTGRQRKARKSTYDTSGRNRGLKLLGKKALLAFPQSLYVFSGTTACSVVFVINQIWTKCPVLYL